MAATKPLPALPQMYLPDGYTISTVGLEKFLPLDAMQAQY